MEKIEQKKENRRVLGMRMSRFKEISFLRSIILNLISIVVLGALVVVLGMLKGRATEINELRSRQFAAQSSVDFDVLRAGLARNSNSIQTLEGAFVDESGIVRFVQDVELLRSQGLVSRFSFLSNEPIVDKTKNRAIPFQVEFSGDINNINLGVSRLESLPYLIRAENMEISRNEAGTSVLYIGLLYVE